ncbi:MAG: glutaredoxin family protein [Thermoplasmatota archaeon]
MIEMTQVDGKDKGSIRLFALSTCVWCRKTKKLLDSLNVAYDFIYVDLLEGKEKDEVMDEVEKWNPRGSFPTIIINDQAIAGFKEQQIKEKLA